MASSDTYQGRTMGIVTDATTFSLNARNLTYSFHIDPSTQDLISTHFGGPSTESVPANLTTEHGWAGLPSRIRREYPDLGRGDFRTPAVRIRQAAGHTISDLRYKSHAVVKGKPELGDGLPATFGGEADVETLIVSLYDEHSRVGVDLSYSVFPAHDAIVRSAKVTNHGEGEITIERLASLSVDMPFEEYEMMGLRGDWSREAQIERRKLYYGTQGFGSTTGSSSHLHNPFLALVHPSTTETHGSAWGFSLVYSGSFSVEVEKASQGLARAVLGLHPLHLSYPLAPGESLTSPECVAVYSPEGVGGMSRRFHRLFREHLIKGPYVDKPRPVLLNSWEGLDFSIDEKNVYELAKETAELGISLFVMDDGWFGSDYPRVLDNAGLGDWVVNEKKFPSGLPDLVERITKLKVGATHEKLKFGIWFEPEMVNPESTLYKTHPDWALHAGTYPRTEARSQLVLNLALPEVQDFIIDSVSNILASAPIAYVKWDSNRGLHEIPHLSTAHRHVLGLYRVFDTLTTRFPDILWEGCASGGGRFDPGVLRYFDQIWTSDCTDALERIYIQFGTSLVYPASTMGAHISAVPNWATKRITSIEFRAHVAMMGGSFGVELNPSEMPPEEKEKIPAFVALAERINPVIIGGDMWRINLPDESNWPAAVFVSRDGSRAVLFCFQLRALYNSVIPYVKLQGLEAGARYVVDGGETYSGDTLMSVGLNYQFKGDFQSRIVLLERC